MAEKWRINMLNGLVRRFVVSVHSIRKIPLRCGKLKFGEQKVSTFGRLTNKTPNDMKEVISDDGSYDARRNAHGWWFKSV